jgi:hypothetical protein
MSQILNKKLNKSSKKTMSYDEIERKKENDQRIEGVMDVVNMEELKMGEILLETKEECDHSVLSMDTTPILLKEVSMTVRFTHNEENFEQWKLTVYDHKLKINVLREIITLRVNNGIHSIMIKTNLLSHGIKVNFIKHTIKSWIGKPLPPARTPIGNELINVLLISTSVMNDYSRFKDRMKSKAPSFFAEQKKMQEVDELQIAKNYVDKSEKHLKHVQLDVRHFFAGVELKEVKLRHVNTRLYDNSLEIKKSFMMDKNFKKAVRAIQLIKETIKIASVWRDNLIRTSVEEEDVDDFVWKVFSDRVYPNYSLNYLPKKLQRKKFYLEPVRIYIGETLKNQQLQRKIEKGIKNNELKIGDICYIGDNSDLYNDVGDLIELSTIRHWKTNPRNTEGHRNSRKHHRFKTSNKPGRRHPSKSVINDLDLCNKELVQVVVNKLKVDLANIPRAAVPFDMTKSTSKKILSKAIQIYRSCMNNSNFSYSNYLSDVCWRALDGAILLIRNIFY